ncbi:hypothetical protein ACHAWT_001389 [Skeletonema menzelii]
MSHQETASTDETENNESAITTKLIITAAASPPSDSVALPPPSLLPNNDLASANSDNPLMAYFGDEMSEENDSNCSVANNDKNQSSTHGDSNTIVLPSLQMNGQEQKSDNNIDTRNDGNVAKVQKEELLVSNDNTAAVSIGQEKISTHSDNDSKIATKQPDEATNNNQIDDDDVAVEFKSVSSSSSSKNDNITTIQHDKKIITTSPSISPPTLPTNNINDDDDDSAISLSPGTQTLVAEAERQAAIAAAISANMANSPSAAGNIAKVMMNSNRNNVMTVTPPGPPIALQQQHQPTMVVLPPLSPPPPSSMVGGSGSQQMKQRVMKPVKFQHVRIAFDKFIICSDILEHNQSDQRKKKNDDVVGGHEVKHGGVGDGGPSEATTTASTIIDVETRVEMEKQLSSNQTSSSTTLPDSFLRFLLLLANVPIIIEEGEKSTKQQRQQQQQSRSSSSSTSNNLMEPSENNGTSSSSVSKPSQAAVEAAQRAYELYTLAQNTFDSISKRQLQSQQDGKRGDATASFFAACSGEIVKVSAGDDGDDNNNIATGIVVGKDGDKIGNTSGRNIGHLPTAVAVAMNTSTNGVVPQPPPPPPPTKMTSSPLLSSIPTTTSASAAAAVASASAVFSNVMSKVTKKQSSFSDIGKKFMSGSSSVLSSGSSGGGGDRSSFNMSHKKVWNDEKKPFVNNNNEEEEVLMEDYEVTIDQEMLGLTVENVLERTIIRTLLPNGAAIHAGAKIGSLIAKVGNVDTSNLTHFETIDELRQSQRPLKLTLRYIGSDILRCAREEMGRLIRGRIDPTLGGVGGQDDEMMMMMMEQQLQLSLEESFDSVLRDRWSSSSVSTSSSLSGPSSMMKMSSSSSSPAVMTRADMIHHAGKDLIRILTLLVVGMEKELVASAMNEEYDQHSASKQHLSSKELNEAIEITSKILLEYSRGHSEMGKRGSASAGSSGRQIGSSFYPVPPGRVQGKKQKGKGRGKKSAEESPLLRIGDALQRTRFFLVETSSTTATALRWEIIDYLCTVLDLDTEQELSEKESASATDGGEASPTNDLGSAGSILKLIVLNCSTLEDTINYAVGDDLSLSLDDQSTRSGHTSHAGNAFISVVHRLAASKSTSARIAACSLGPVLWSHLDFPRQLQLRGVITRALHDVEVIVRKSTAAVLHEIAELVFDRRSVPWLVLMCERSMTDPEPQLRAAAMTLTWHLAEHLPNAFTGDAHKGSLSIRRLPPRTDPTFMDVYLLQCKLLPVASNLAEDRMASVRLSVAAQCDRLVNAMGEHWFNIIIDLLQALLSDSDERVRSEATLCMPRFAESVILGTAEGQDSKVLESLMPLALKIQRDPSPLVRSSLATAAGELLIFLVGLGGASHDAPSSPLRKREGSEAPPSPRSPRREGSYADETGYKRYKKHVDDTFIPILQKLLQDPDPEVTTASLRAVTNASRSSARSSASTPSCSHNNNKFDTGDDDLASVASVTSLQSHLSVDRTKPVFIPVLSEKQVLRLLPTLSNLATSAQWRVRQSAVEIVPALLGCTHRHETRHEISKLCLTLMSDKVDAVRKTAAECLCLGGSNLAMHGEDDGGEWISKIVIPHLKTCSRSEDSKQRMLSLKMIEIIITNGLCPAHLDVVKSGDVSSSSHSGSSEAATKGSAVRSILSIAASLALDAVPNVRFNVGRAFAVIMGMLDRSNAEFAASVLEQQIEEEKSRDASSDRDVIYFAQQALSIFRQQSTLSDLRRESSLMD